jgi:carbon monoxide dehydrogenase subunit G
VEVKKMTTIIREISINASQQKVWDILADFGGIYKFNPGVSKSYSTSTANGGVGATRHCDLLPAGAVEERIIEWHEGRDYKIEIYKGKGAPPFKTAVGHLKVQPDGSGSKVSMHFHYSLKFGFIGSLMDRLLVKNQFSKAVPGILAGLKHYAETGEMVDNKVRLDRQLVTAVA